MSQKQDNIRSDAEAITPELLTEDLGSNNGCPVKLSDSDSESESDDPDQRVLCGGCGRPVPTNGPRKKFCNHACYSASLRVGIQDRFFSKVNTFGPLPADASLGRCWLWTASTIRGYGQIASLVNGKHRPAYAHRVAWELTHGPIPADLFVLHKCDVPLCVNPSHLFLGTQQNNLTDARQKGRLVESNPRTRTLTPAERMMIFRMPHHRGLGRELAKQYGVSKSCISLIRCGRFARFADIANVEPVRCVPVPVRGELHASHRLATTSMPVSPVLGNQIGAVR